MKVLITRLDKDLPLPNYAKGGDAGADIYARIDFELAPGARALIPTGIAIALPDGYVALVHPRSGLAIKSGISMVNTPGTVDAGYRGELQVILINHDLAKETGKRARQKILDCYSVQSNEANFLNLFS